MQILTTTVAILMLVNLATALSMKGHDESLPEFCWRDTYGRGVGVIPSICPAGKDKIGLLCYTKCPEGFKRFGFDCYQLCPASATWNDQGLFCRLSEYGRGAGYPWKFGDPLNDRGSKGRCESANGIGNCEKNGLLYYPKCRSGYYSIGCCICRPSIPNCKALGFNGGFDLSCTKKIIIGDPKNMDCPPGKFYDAGLCYAGCKTGYLEVGPLCWGNGPAGWIDCGMGAAKDQKTCSETIFDEVTSVGSLALNLATAGTGKAASIAKNFAEAAKLETLFEKMKDLANKSGKVQDVISKGQGKFPVVAAGKSTGELLKADPDTLTPEDMVRASAQIAALTDPTGASDKFVATTYPKCTTIQL